MGMGVPTLGGFLGGAKTLLRVFSNDELDQMETERERAAMPSEPILALAAHVRHAFDAAVNHRQTSGVTDRLLRCQRQRLGVYEPDKATAIRAQGGSDLYFNLTDTKCSAAEGWIFDVLAPAGDKPWMIEPTPIPDLPESLKQQIINRVVQLVQAEAMAGNEMAGPDIYELTLELYDEELDAQRAESKRRAERMDAKIYDQLLEGGFTEAFDGFVRDLCTYPVAILKGPIVRKERRTKWVDGVVQVVEEIIPTWSAVHPQDFYPSPNCTDVNTGYLCERVTFDRSTLAGMAGVEGWNAAEIEAALGDGAVRIAPMLPGEDSRADMEHRPAPSTTTYADQPVEAVEYWGTASAAELREWGMQVEDGTAFVPIHAILVGSHVVKAIKNPDPLGRRPYYVTSYERVANSLYGRSIPERMTDCQDGVNGCLRNLLNNLALASGPQVGVDIDALDAGTDVAIYPWKAWQYHGRKVEFSRQPLTFFQPQSNAEQLIGVADYFENKSDDRTLIPRYTHGSEAMGGAAGETASGLSMLLNAAAKGIKNVIAHVDKDVIQPAISSIYTWNLLYLPDDQWAEIKGDCRVVARGALAMLVREQLQARRQEFLDRTANDIDLQIIGVEGRATVLRSIAEDLGYPRDEVVPSKEDLIRRMQAQAMQAAEPGEDPEDEPEEAPDAEEA